MAHGEVKGKVTSVYRKRVRDLVDKAKVISRAFRYQDNFREWHTPRDLEGKDMLLVPGMHNPPWARNEPNILYSQTILNTPNIGSGTTGDIISVKLQIDFLSVEERAWRMRHMSLIRGACLAHGRLNGHSESGSGIFNRAVRVVQDYIDAGKKMKAP
jgi:hypothetical protein